MNIIHRLEKPPWNSAVHEPDLTISVIRPNPFFFNMVKLVKTNNKLNFCVDSRLTIGKLHVSIVDDKIRPILLSSTSELCIPIHKVGIEKCGTSGRHNY